ncbi:MAG: hypothetical protein WCL23_01950 [Candidatus Moraniibacteriota bacterium]
MRELIPYEKKVIAYFKASVGLTDRAEEKMRELFAFEPRTEWRLDQYGWRIALAICISFISAALSFVLIIDEFGNGFPERVTRGAEAIIWVFYAGTHVVMISETLRRYFRKPKVTLDRDAVLNAYEYFLKPFEDTFHKSVMILMIAVLVITDRIIIGFVLSILLVAFLAIEHVAANKIRDAIRNV